MPTLSVRKNNLAAKKSRDARRVRENQLRLRVLCSENQIRWVSEHNWKRKKREKKKNGRKKGKIVNLTRQNKDRENIEKTGMSYFPISIFYLYLFFSLALGFDLRRSSGRVQRAGHKGRGNKQGLGVLGAGATSCI